MSDECPTCGEPMESGSVYASRFAAWLSEGDRVPLWWPPEEAYVIPVSWFKTKKVPARRCVACRRVEFHYGPPPQPRPDTRSFFER